MKKIIEASGRDLEHIPELGEHDNELEQILQDAGFKRGHGFIRNDVCSDIDFRDYMNEDCTALILISRAYCLGACSREIVTFYGGEKEIAKVIKPLRETYERRYKEIKEE